MALPRGAAPAQLPPATLTPDLTAQLDQPQLLRKELDSFVRRLRLFTPGRWSASAPALGSRADVVRHLAQACADAAAAVEGDAVRELPVVRPDLLLADQLAVTGDDLLRAVLDAQGGPAGSAVVAGPPGGPVEAAGVVGPAVAHLLLHRWHVLGDEPPAALGGPAVLELGRSVCSAA